MEYHMLYKKSIKSFEVIRDFFYFAVCLNKTHSKAYLCVCQKKAHGKACVPKKALPCVIFLPCVHMAKSFFAVCPIESTRQTTGHTANTHFPVVGGCVHQFSIGSPCCEAKCEELNSQHALSTVKNVSSTYLFFYFSSIHNPATRDENENSNSQ